MFLNIMTRIVGKVHGKAKFREFRVFWTILQKLETDLGLDGALYDN